MTLDLVGVGGVQSYEPARAAQLKGAEDRVGADRLRGRIGVGGHGRSPVSARGEDHQTSPARPSGAHEIFCARCLVMGTYIRPVEKHLAKLGLTGIAQHRKGALPYPPA